VGTRSTLAYLSKRQEPSSCGPVLSGSGSGTPLLEALPAKYWPSLCRFEGDGSFLATLGANRACFHPRISGACGRCPAYSRDSFGFTRLAALGLVFELLVEEEELLTRGKDELGPAVHAFQYLVLELHRDTPPFSDPISHEGIG